MTTYKPFPPLTLRRGATVIKIVPTPYENEWKVELKIPNAVRRLHMPLPEDPVRFTAKVGIHEAEVSGVYQFKWGQAFVMLDDAGGGGKSKVCGR